MSQQPPQPLPSTRPDDRSPSSTSSPPGPLHPSPVGGGPSLSPSDSSFILLDQPFQDAVLDGLKLSSILVPPGLLLRHFQTPRRPSTIPRFFRLNGLYTFAFGLTYAALASSALVPAPSASLISPALRVRTNDYSIIGGTLGGVTTAGLFWHRGSLQALSMVPGGIAIGIAAGLSTALVHTSSPSPPPPARPPP